MSNYTECPSCGTEISKTAKKCPFCGVKLKKPFYKKGWFVFLVLLCFIGGIGYLGKVYFGFNYLELAKQGGNWIHDTIVSTEIPSPGSDTTDETNPELAEDGQESEISEETAADEGREDVEEADTEDTTAQNQEQTAVPESDSVMIDGDVVVCTASEMTRTYENNVLAGNLDYRGKTCRISGTIKTFGEAGGQPYVILNGWNSGSMVGVRCFAASLEDVKALAGMKMGQKLTMEGICTGLSINVDIENAHIVSAGYSAESENPIPVKKPVRETIQEHQPAPVEEFPQPSELPDEPDPMDQPDEMEESQDMDNDESDTMPGNSFHREASTR